MHFRLPLIMETNTRGQSDLGPYCLQNRLPKIHKQIIKDLKTIVMHGWEKVMYFVTLFVYFYKLNSQLHRI